VTEDAPVLLIDEVREEVAPEVTGKIADTLDVAAERTAPEGSPRSGHPRVRAMMIAAGVAAGGLLAMKALRAVRSAKHDREDAGWDEYDPSKFPADLPDERAGVDPAQAKLDDSVAAAKEAVTDLTDRHRSAPH